MPVELRVVIEVEINALSAGAVEISRQRSESPFQVRRAARRVVPLVANLVATGRVERQRIAIAIERAIKRHPGIDAIIERALHHVGVCGFAGRGEHAPIPHHVADGRATFPVGPRIGQFIGITESLAVAARADSAGDVHLR